MKEEHVGDGKKVLALAVLPQGSETGFFLVRQFDARSASTESQEPLMVNAVTLELANGETLRVVAKREKKPVTQGLEWALAGVLKEMADCEQVRVDGDGDPYLLYSDLAEAFNARYAKPGDELKPRTVGVICRDVFQWPVYRMDAGWAVYLDQARLAELAERFGLNVSTAEGAVARLASVIVAYMKERALNITVKGKKAILYSDLAGFYNARFCNDAEMRANMVGQILRDDLRLTTERTGRGWALVLVEEQILAMAERFGLELANFDFWIKD